MKKKRLYLTKNRLVSLMEETIKSRTIPPNAKEIGSQGLVKKCTCNINGAETDIGHFKDCPACEVIKAGGMCHTSLHDCSPTPGKDSPDLKFFVENVRKAFADDPNLPPAGVHYHIYQLLSYLEPFI